MAHGKSLELQKIEKPAPERLCICGLVWGAHYRKRPDANGQLVPLAKFESKMGTDHYAAGMRGMKPFTRKR